jgi:catalase
MSKNDKRRPSGKRATPARREPPAPPRGDAAPTKRSEPAGGQPGGAAAKSARGDAAAADALARRQPPLPRRPSTLRLPSSGKLDDLEGERDRADSTRLTTDHGVPIEHTDDSLKAGERGPTLLEDFHLREKITRFDHERIPERVVHARGTGAHGWFQLYESLEPYTSADFLCDTSAATPVFVRFSTVVGSRGSADTVRDVRGFATKFYTRQGNFDLVGNNIPVFFIQDGAKFPDLVHAIKPEPHHEMPQASSAHDTFWDFISLVPETLHMVMWLMSDRTIPRSYRMMEGFGVHTFRLVNTHGRATLCKFHWKPLLGAHSLVWDESQQLCGRDPDFHRRDLWEAIEAGKYPQYELGLQLIDAKDEQALGFDLLDPTKLVPEELVPVRRVGRLTLHRNPDNFFAEVEQVAFCVNNLVPGIDVTEDPLMQARLFSYLDTQLTRLGGPNFAEIPINRPIAPVHNHQQDGFHRRTVPTARAMYHPNSIENGMPALAARGAGFASVPQRVQGTKTRARSESFADHFAQARMFLDSQSPAERRHLVEACRFEIGKVERLGIRERVVALFRQIDPELAAEVAAGVGVAVERAAALPLPENGQARGGKRMKPSPALSLANQPRTSILTRKVAVLVADGVRFEDYERVCAAVCGGGGVVETVSHALGPVRSVEGRPIDVCKTWTTGASVLYDALCVLGGEECAESLQRTDAALSWLREAYAHAKTIGALQEGVAVLARAGLGDVQLATADDDVVSSAGVVTAGADAAGAFGEQFADALRQHRHFDRADAHRTA